MTELCDFFREYPSVAVAFSGGTDSSYLLYAASKFGKRVHAYYVKTEFQPEFEQEDAERTAKELHVPLTVLHRSVFSCENIIKNGADRCYYCKKEMFGAIVSATKADGFDVLLDGTNASDEKTDRPGMRALSEWSVRSPLRECGLTKRQIRRLSQEAGLFTAEKPAYACLATRVETGEQITEQQLKSTEAAETFLHSLGCCDFRIRSRNGCALIQLRERDWTLLAEHRSDVLNMLKRYYRAVSLDLEVRK